MVLGKQRRIYLACAKYSVKTVVGFLLPEDLVLLALSDADKANYLIDEKIQVKEEEKT